MLLINNSEFIRSYSHPSFMINNSYSKILSIQQRLRSEYSEVIEYKNKPIIISIHCEKQAKQQSPSPRLNFGVLKYKDQCIHTVPSSLIGSKPDSNNQEYCVIIVDIKSQLICLNWKHLNYLIINNSKIKQTSLQFAEFIVKVLISLDNILFFKYIFDFDQVYLRHYKTTLYLFVLTKIHLMKVLIVLTILVALSSQALLASGSNPLIGKTFTISYDSLGASSSASFEVSFTGNRLDFKGCNQNQASYTLSSSGQFSIKGQWSSTKKICPVDLDKTIQSLFKNSNEISQANGKIEFSKDSTVYIRLSLQNPLKGKKFGIIQTSLKNSYLVGIEVGFTADQIRFRLCKTHSSTYKLGDNNQFSLETLWVSEIVACQSDEENLIEQIFKNSVRFEIKSDGKAYFYDKDNKLSILLTAQFGVQALNPFINRNFLVSSATQKIKYVKGLSVTFNENFITYKLCKLNHGRYIVRSGNRFDITYWSGLPLWTCKNLLDNNISLALIQITNYKAGSDGNYLFYDNSSNFIIQLKEIEQTLQEFEGKFLIKENVANSSSINGIVVQFKKSDGTLTFYGCSNYTASYIAQSDGYFEITNTWTAANVTCEVNNDKLLRKYLVLCIKWTYSQSKLTLITDDNLTVLVLEEVFNQQN